MKLNPKQAAFGRHETFPLRYSWLTKAYQEVFLDSQVFDSDDSTVKLGVGKNMVSAIRYWALATGIIDRIEGVQGHYKTTPFGRFLFDEAQGCDPFLEDEATLWLLHWRLASNPSLATGIYWLFNRYHKPEFTSAEALDALEDFAKHNLSGKYSKNTLKNDVAVILRMYTDAPFKPKAALDDMLDAPFVSLKLLSMLSDNKTHCTDVGYQDNLPDEILGYAIASLFLAVGTKSIPLEDLMYGKTDFPAPGAVFNLTESAFVAKLENLKQQTGIFDLRESAGVNLLYQLPEVVEPMSFLSSYYERRVFQEMVA